MNPLKEQFQPLPAYVVGFTAAVLYGVAMRYMVGHMMLGDGIILMSRAFIIGVPLAVGFLAVRPHPNPSWLYAIFFPWGPTTSATLLTAVIGYEGAICIFMALPIILVVSSVGGLVAAFLTRRKLARGAAVGAMLLPLAMGGIERGLPQPLDVHAVRNSITIAAPADVVWREIVSVREITREEMPGNPLFLRLGFPRPLSAEIDREEVGGIRRARFAGGVLFLETVTDLVPDSLLSFTIHAETDSIPAGTLDEHVTIGGPYFDVLRGTYTIERVGADSVRLYLESRLRVSTHFNWYASVWADAVMGSIQRNILEVEKARAEGAH